MGRRSNPDDPCAIQTDHESRPGTKAASGGGIGLVLPDDLECERVSGFSAQRMIGSRPELGTLDLIRELVNRYRSFMQVRRMSPWVRAADCRPLSCQISKCWISVPPIGHPQKFRKGRISHTVRIPSPSQLRVRSCGPSFVLTRHYAGRPRHHLHGKPKRQPSGALLLAGESVDITGASVRGSRCCSRDETHLSKNGALVALRMHRR